MNLAGHGVCPQEFRSAEEKADHEQQSQRQEPYFGDDSLGEREQEGPEIEMGRKQRINPPSWTPSLGREEARSSMMAEL